MNVYDVDTLRRKLAVIEVHSEPIAGALTIHVPILSTLEDSMSINDPFFHIQPRHAMVDGLFYRGE